MKIRNGFVSNSSSSSFIVAVNDTKGAENTKVTITMEIDLTKYANTVCRTLKELNDFVENEWGYESAEVLLSDEEKGSWEALRYIKAKEAIESGKVILFGYFSDNENSVETFLCNEGLEGHVDESKITIIEGKGGY